MVGVKIDKSIYVILSKVEFVVVLYGKVYGFHIWSYIKQGYVDIYQILSYHWNNGSFSSNLVIMDSFQFESRFSEAFCPDCLCALCII